MIKKVTTLNQDWTTSNVEQKLAKAPVNRQPSTGLPRFIGVNYLMNGFEVIIKACEILELSSMATRDEIKSAYRDLSRRYHPDRCSEKNKESCAEKFREITRAKDILLAYLDSYRYIFTEDEFKNHLAPDSQEHFERFFFDWF